MEWILGLRTSSRTYGGLLGLVLLGLVVLYQLHIQTFQGYSLHSFCLFESGLVYKYITKLVICAAQYSNRFGLGLVTVICTCIYIHIIYQHKKQSSHKEHAALGLPQTYHCLKS
jgi:hypothetical protein